MEESGKEEEQLEKKSDEKQDNLTEREKKLIDLLQKKGELSVSRISEIFDISKEEVWPFVDGLRAKGYDIIELNRKMVLRALPTLKRVVRLPKITSRTVKILVTSDWGLGLRQQQMSLVETANNIGEKEKVWFSLIAGNVCAGRPIRTKRNDFFLTEREEQLDYLIKNVPRVSFNHYLINGPNEMSFPSPKSIGEELAEQRDDIKFYGDKEATFIVGKKTKITLMHIEGDPSVYTKSYPLQGAMESFQEAVNYVLSKEREPPHILLVGGIHADVEIPPRMPLRKGGRNNFYAIALPSLHALTIFQQARKRRGVSPVIGCLIITLEFDEEGELKGEPKFDTRHLTPYIKEEDYLEEVKPKEDLTDEQKKVLSSLDKSSRSWGELSRILKKSILHAEEVVGSLKSAGYNIVWIPAEKRLRLVKGLKEKFEPLSLEMGAKSAKCAVTSDPHLGHIKSRPELLKPFYEIAEEKKVDKIFICGDIFDGDGAYFGQRWELTHHGADEQRDYGLEIWPASEIPTEIIRGSSHEFAYNKSVGHNIVETFARLARAERRLKLKYIGEDEIGNRGVSEINGIGFQLFHPVGGIPYGLSYRPQKLIETVIATMNSTGDEKIFLCGHLHVAFSMIYKGALILLSPCLEDQTQYLVDRSLVPWLGGWIIEVFTDSHENITRVVKEYIPFEPKRERSRGKEYKKKRTTKKRGEIKK